MYHDKNEIFRSAENSRRLIVLVHGTGVTAGSAQRMLAKTLAVVQCVLPDSDCFLPRLRAHGSSFRNPDHIVDDLIDAITKLWEERRQDHRPYEEVILVGYSFGSVLARSVYCRARGVNDAAELNGDDAAPWAANVTRIVLLAGMNRGWTTDSPVSRLAATGLRIATAVGHLVSPLREPTLFSIRRGAPFLTQMRLQWLALVRAHAAPLTIQLLGTKDDLVSPADNIDLATGGDFIYLEVPGSGHFNVVDMKPPAIAASRRMVFEFDRKDLAQTRGEVFGRALLDEPADLKKTSLAPDDMDDRARFVRQVVDGDMGSFRHHDDLVLFVMHGIRDRGYWTKKIARHVRDEARKANRTVHSITSSYGYFAMLPFLRPSTRREKVEWFLEEYVNARTLFPRAPIYFVGHSNGTYLLGSALKRCRAVKFCNVVLAGSVLQRRFDWEAFVLRRQISNVLNYVATGDWVVAIFPRVFEVVPLQDLGSAGHNGFAGESRKHVQEREYVQGRHSAALDERHWGDIARFLLEGPKSVAQASIARRRSRTVWALGKLSLFIWLALISVLVMPIALMLDGLGLSLPYLRDWSVWKQLVQPFAMWEPWKTAATLAAHLALVRLILTKL